MRSELLCSMLHQMPDDILLEIARHLTAKEIARLAVLAKPYPQLSHQLSSACTSFSLDCGTSADAETLTAVEEWLINQSQLPGARLRRLQVCFKPQYTFTWPGDCL